MAAVIKLANCIKKVGDQELFSTQENAEQIYTDEWQNFMSGEVEKSNKADLTTLGGASKFQGEDSAEDEPAHFEDNMDAIMGRFNSFNSLMGSGNSGTTEREEQERDEPPVIIAEFQEEKIYPDIEVKLPEEEDEENCDYHQNVYWSSPTETVDDDELDSMLEDYE